MRGGQFPASWGEFSGTRKQVPSSREHWPQVAMGILAGGGLKTGQVIGSTDRNAAMAASRPRHYQEVFATLYRHLGIDARTISVTDATGRTHPLVEMGRPIEELP